MNLKYQEYRPRKILNVHKHVDGPWFWGKYSAHPYTGCSSGCEFCYSRGSRYLGRRDPDTFDTLIQVKVNAVDLLKKELPKQAKAIIACGDWQQPTEDKYRLSRKMLEVVVELGFPLFIVERSPLLIRDLDILSEINRRAWVGVVYSISNVDPKLKKVFEPKSPGVQFRLKAMEKLAEAGIQVGTSMMPVIPFAGDDEAHLDDTIRATKDHGGTFVMGGGMTMDGIQAECTLAAAQRLSPGIEEKWRKLYNWREGGKPAYGPTRTYNARVGLLIRELCHRHGILDRMPRYIAPGPLAVNTRIAERLFLKTYDLELQQAADYRIWAYRRAAWTLDEMTENVADLYQNEGCAGLIKLSGIGQRIASQIIQWLKEEIRDYSPR